MCARSAWDKNDHVVGAVVLRRSDTTILVATVNGFGKRSDTEEYRISHRGGKGIFTVKTTDKTGKMVAIREVKEKDDVVIVTNRGVVIRQHASDIRVAGRNTQGVRLIKLDAGDAVSDVAACRRDDETRSNGNGAKAGAEEERTCQRDANRAVRGENKNPGKRERVKVTPKKAGVRGAETQPAGRQRVPTPRPRRRNRGPRETSRPKTDQPKPPEPGKRAPKQKPKGRR